MLLAVLACTCSARFYCRLRLLCPFPFSFTRMKHDHKSRLFLAFNYSFFLSLVSVVPSIFLVSLPFLSSFFSSRLSGKKSKSVFDFLTYSRETGFSFSYGKVKGLIQMIGTSDEISRVSKFDNSLSFGAKQNAL